MVVVPPRRIDVGENVTLICSVAVKVDRKIAYRIHTGKWTKVDDVMSDRVEVRPPISICKFDWPDERDLPYSAV